ncbi:MAG: RNA polymerase sigma factor [Candidatus Glassbacteria bacterium]
MQKDSPFKALLECKSTDSRYETLLSLLEQRITSVARKRVPGWAVQDIVQDTLLVLLRKLSTLRSHDEILPLTFTILRNMIGNHYQGEKTEKKYRAKDFEDPAYDHLEKIETYIYQSEILELCNNLDGDFSRIVKMVLDGYSQDEITKEMGLKTKEALYSRVHRGRKLIKQALKEKNL